MGVCYVIGLLNWLEIADWVVVGDWGLCVWIFGLRLYIGLIIHYLSTFVKVLFLVGFGWGGMLLVDLILAYWRWLGEYWGWLGIALFVYLSTPLHFTL